MKESIASATTIDLTRELYKDSLRRVSDNGNVDDTPSGLFDRFAQSMERPILELPTVHNQPSQTSETSAAPTAATETPEAPIDDRQGRGQRVAEALSAAGVYGVLIEEPNPTDHEGSGIIVDGEELPNGTVMVDQTFNNVTFN